MVCQFAQSSFADGHKDPLVVGIGYPSNFFNDVDQRDAQVALELWTEQVSTSMGTPLSPRSFFYDSLPDLVTAFREHEIEVATMGVVDFLEARSLVSIEPFLVAESNGQAGDRFLLVCHRKKKIESIRQMRGFRLAIETGRVSNPLPLLWLDTLLMENDLGSKESFFSELPRIGKSSKVVLPVFFERTDACLVTERGFESITEMNPQVGEELVIISRSPRLVRALTVIRTDCDQRIRKTFREGALQLDRYPKGRQILTIFRQSRIVAFRPEHLSGARSIVQKLGTPDSGKHGEAKP